MSKEAWDAITELGFAAVIIAGILAFNTNFWENIGEFFRSLGEALVERAKKK